VPQQLHFPPPTAATESRFRRWTRAQDSRSLVVLVSIVAVAATGFAALDILFYGSGPYDHVVLLTRALVLAASCGALLIARRIPRPLVFDCTATAWLAAALAMQLVVAMVRPAGWSPVPVMNMLLVLGAYTLLPVPLPFQAVPAVLFSLANCLVILGAGNAYPERVRVTLVAAYLVANVLGLIVSRRHGSLRRRQFRVLEHERQARRGLRAALDEVKVLRGIVPICSVCKKIRNDDGLYEAVEAYVTRHSEADFSHTLCPDCLRREYPGETGRISS
jgi:hypothetical protein